MNPLEPDFNVQRICRVLQGQWNSLVCWYRLAVVANQADRNVLSHSSYFPDDAQLLLVGLRSNPTPSFCYIFTNSRAYLVLDFTA